MSPSFTQRNSLLSALGDRSNLMTPPAKTFWGLKKLYTFGVSGRLYKSNVLLYDHQTESLWSQLLEKAISGSLAGKRLDKITSVRTTWKAWRKKTLTLWSFPQRPDIAATICRIPMRVTIEAWGYGSQWAMYGKIFLPRRWSSVSISWGRPERILFPCCERDLEF